MAKQVVNQSPSIKSNAQSALNDYFDGMLAKKQADSSFHLEQNINQLKDLVADQNSPRTKSSTEQLRTTSNHIIDEYLSPSEKLLKAEKLLQSATEVGVSGALDTNAVERSAIKGNINIEEPQNLSKDLPANADINKKVDIFSDRPPEQLLKQFLNESFSVLLFKVNGMTLAIPLVELGGILKLDKISPIVGKPAWFLGVFSKGSENFHCIDTALWVMPEKQNETNEDLQYKYALRLNKSSYVLCCDSITTTVELHKDDIKWRTSDDKRPWLSGLLKEEMCALIDGTKVVQHVLNH